MTLYHGSNVIVEMPNLVLSRKNLDFGFGFYTTENREQAVAFAQKVMIRKEQKNQRVSVYDFDEDSAESVLDILRFPSIGKLWLDFVHQNRRGTYVEQTLDALKVKDLYSQFVFKTEKALSFLRYVNSFEPEAVP